MKRSLKSLLILSVFPLLVSCSEVQAFEWWDTENLSIVRAILEKDAKDAYNKAQSNLGALTSSKTSFTANTYNKDYLANFVSETDSNTSISQTIFTDRYSNDITVTSSKATAEKWFKNAHQNGTTTVDSYLVGYADKKQTLQRTITDYGYGDAIGVETITNYDSNEKYQKSLFISVTSFDDWTNTTYGLAKNEMIIIEKSTSINVPYVVPFSGLEIKECNLNIYSLFRIKKIEDTYLFDYFHETSTLQIAKDEFGNQLNEPFTLSKNEIVTRYYNEVMTAFDISKIPVIPE